MNSLSINVRLLIEARSVPILLIEARGLTITCCTIKCWWFFLNLVERRRPPSSDDDDGGPTGRRFRGEFGTYGHGYLFLSRGPLFPMAATTQEVAVLEPTPIDISSCARANTYNILLRVVFQSDGNLQLARRFGI
jgi:hypothetical protein